MALAAPLPPRSALAAEPAGGGAAPAPRAPRALLVALVGCLLYAAFAGGATSLPDEAPLQVALLVIAAAAIAGWLYGIAPAPSASRLAWAGVGLLAAFAA